MTLGKRADCVGFSVQIISFVFVPQYLNRSSINWLFPCLTSEVKAIIKQAGSECCQAGAMMQYFKPVLVGFGDEKSCYSYHMVLCTICGKCWSKGMCEQRKRRIFALSLVTLILFIQKPTKTHPSEMSNQVVVKFLICRDHERRITIVVLNH